MKRMTELSDDSDVSEDETNIQSKQSGPSPFGREIVVSCRIYVIYARQLSSKIN